MNGNRIRSIDGIRAVSIIMVVLAHASHSIPSCITNKILFKYVSNSALGVSFFFVISGYLITKLLLAEKEKKGSISIKNFYFRRIFRIFPIFYLYIITVVLIKIFFVHHIFHSYYLVVFACLYIWNYKHLFSYQEIGNDEGNWFFGHFWSLSMEEQFYLLWPLVFQRVNKELLIKSTLIIIVLMPLLRVTTYFVMPNSRGQIGMMLQTGGDTILIGCVGALLENKILHSRLIRFMLNNNYIVLLVCAFTFVISPFLSERLRGAYSLSIGISLNNITIFFLVLWAIHIPSIISKILNLKLFIYIGMLSYSLYIWQQLFLGFESTNSFSKFPLNIIVIIIVSIVSYNVIEKPILKLKSRFEANR